MFEALLIVFLLSIVAALFSGLAFLYRERGGGRRAVRALSWRVGLSLALFALLLLAHRLGWLPAR